jgi:hypothetical protein
MFNGEVTQRTLELLKGIDLAKATFQTSTGLVNFDLTGPAKKLYPVLSPLRNALPRVMGHGDTATRWKAITGVNAANLSPGVAEGHRGGRIAVSEQDYTAAYAGLGLEADVTFEALYAAEGFDDARARTVESVLRALMIAEERVILNGNNSLALGTPAAPSLTLVAGGSMTAQATFCYVVALTAEGFLNATIAGGVPTLVNRANIDGTNDSYGGGSSQIGAVSSSVTTSGGNLSVKATVTAVPGAAGYAWFYGPTGAVNCKLGAITTTNTATFTADAAGTQAANSITQDNSRNGFVFDGIVTQSIKNGAGYFKSLDGAVLTSDGASGIVEIDAALKAQWDSNRLTPTKIWLSSQEAANINKKVLSATGVPLFRINLGASDKPVVIGGSMVAGYFNKFASGGGQVIPMEIHPYLTAGTLFMQTEYLPYPLSNVDNVAQIKCRRDYHQIDWPITSRVYQFGVYVDEVLQVFAPFSFAVLQNIGNG